MKTKANRPGHDSLWETFGLSYAGWITLPRVLIHEMPDEWQAKMAELIRQYDDHWDFSDLALGTRVQVTKNRKLIETPDWLINYRHPDYERIDDLRKFDVPCSGSNRKG